MRFFREESLLERADVPPGLDGVPLRGLELVASLLGLVHEIGVRHLDEHGVRLDDGAGAHDDAVDARRGLRGDPADLARYERAGAADLAQHLAAADRVDVLRVAHHGRRGRLELRETERHESEQHRGTAAEGDLAQALAAFVFGTWDVHMPPPKQRPCQSSRLG